MVGVYLFGARAGGIAVPSVEAERILRELFSAKGLPEPDLSERRREWLARSENAPLPEGIKTSAVTAGGVISEWVEHDNCLEDAAIVFMHGGGFVSGAPGTHRKLAAHLSKATNIKVLLPDYQLAPEQPFPAGVRDGLSVYGALLSDGVSARRLAFVGDSAGGGLVVSILLALKEAGGPMPSSISLMSPWLDLTNSGASYQTNADNDPTISHERHEKIAEMYYDQADPKNPLISGLFGNLAGLPPTLVQVGDIEVMLDDARVFAERARAAGVSVELDVWERMWHVWQQYVPDVPEAQQAIDKMGEFIKRHLGG